MALSDGHSSQEPFYEGLIFDRVFKENNHVANIIYVRNKRLTESFY